MKRTRILLADDHPQICELLRVLLEPEFQVVGSVTDGEALLQYAQSLQPDVIISDIDMPKVTGMEALQLLHYVAPQTRMIFLTAYGDSTHVAAAFAAGAAGYLIKDMITDLHGTLRRAIQSAKEQTSAPNLASRQLPITAPSAGTHLEH